MRFFNSYKTDAIVCRIYKNPDELENTFLNPLSANPTKWSNTLKQFVGFSGRIECVDHFVGLVLEGLKRSRPSELHIVKYKLFYSVTEVGMFKTEKRYTDGLPCFITSAVLG